MLHYAQKARCFRHVLQVTASGKIDSTLRSLVVKLRAMKAVFRGLFVTILIAVTNMYAANYDVNPTLRALWPNHNVPVGNDLTIAGRIAYIALGQPGFEIIDFTDFESPTHVGTFPVEGFVGGLVANGDRLYVADEAAGLHIFDISNPRQPILLSTTPVRGPACGVAVSGSLVLVTARYAGVHILDAENPKNPKYKGGYDTPGTALRVAVFGNTAYIADFDSGLLALDITNPSAPVSLGSLTTTLRTMDVAANSNYIVTATLLGAEVIDRRNTSRRLNISGRIEDVCISGDYAYLIDNPWSVVAVELPAFGSPRAVGGYQMLEPLNGHTVAAANGLVFTLRNLMVDVINLTNPASPKLEASYSFDNNVPDGAMVGSHAFVLNQRKLNVIDVADPNNLVRLGSIDLQGEPIRIDISGNIAGITFGEGGVSFFDISDPAALRELSHVPLPGNIFAITMSGTRAYVSGQDSGLHIIDFSNPAEPKILGMTPTARISSETVLYGDYAYVAAYQDGLQIFNIADPANIIPKGVFTNFSGLMRDLQIHGTNLFAATDGGLQVFDLSEPAKPRLIADDKTLASGLSIFGDTAYVTGLGMRLVNITDPAHPRTELQNLSYGGKVGGLSGSVAYIVSGRLQVLEFVANPQRMTRFPNIGNATNITVKGKYAYLARGSQGLSIVDVSHSPNSRVVANQAAPSDALEIHGNRAFVVGANGFRIVDVSKADQPQTIGSISGQPMLDVTVTGKTAYAIINDAADKSLAAIDCSDFAHPRITKTIPVISAALATDGKFVYVTDYGLRIFDISDPLDPKLVGVLNTIGTGTATDIEVRGKYAYLTGYGFNVVDVSDPANPWLIGRPADQDSIAASRITISGDYAYVSDVFGGFHVFNIERPGHPERVGGNVQVNVGTLFASNDTLYIAERDGALVILDLFRKDARSMRLTGLEPVLDGVVRLRANGPPGETVQIEKFQEGVWKPWKPLTSGSSPADFIDPEGSATLQMYRIAKP